VFDDGKILLVREASDGRWSLPGGWADVGESLSRAVTREVEEESRYRTRASKLLALVNLERHGKGGRPRANVYKLFVLCELLEAPVRVKGAETTEASWFAEHELPPLSTSRGTPEQLGMMFAHAQDPARPTDFD